MEEMKICKKCGNYRNTSKGSDWTCPYCDHTQWGIIAIYAIVSLFLLGIAIFASADITHFFLRFIVQWGVGSIGAIVLLASIIWMVSALQARRKNISQAGTAEMPDLISEPKMNVRVSDIQSDVKSAIAEPIQNSTKEEQVTHIYPNGNTYIGGWKNDNMNGFGTLSDPDGYFQYVGNWKDGKLNGQGSKTTTGMKYWGEWKDGRYNGQGNLNDLLGKFSYAGEFKDGQMTGHGTMTYADGTVRSGIWENGRLVQE
ncbi:MAG: MORN repeat-containing protein [Saccharofermentanales bacterium]